MRLLSILAGLLLSSAAALAAVALDMKPGLWEHSFTIRSESGQIEAAMAEMQRQLEQMPPAQRQMMEQMMASQGMSLRPGGSSIRACMTAEEIARGQLPQQEGCEQQILEQGRDRLRVRFSCAGNPPTSGEGEVIFHSPTHYTGKAELETAIEGRTERMTIEQTGKWVGADCGAIKPLR
jgi:hypothetical protein